MEHRNRIIRAAFALIAASSFAADSHDELIGLPPTSDELRAFLADKFSGLAEMRAFMQDLEGTDQRAKTGRISLHWSSQCDGVFDRSYRA